MMKRGLGGIFGRSSDKPGELPPSTVIADGVHSRTACRGLVIDALIKCDSLSEREARILAEELGTACDTLSRPRLMVDFEPVEILTSAGIGMLISLNTRLRDAGGGLAVYNLSDDIAQLLKLTRIDRLFPIAGDRLDAYRALAAGG